MKGCPLLVAALLSLSSGLAFQAPVPAQRAPVSFAALVERLSEPGGDFGGDNLISNEQSYLQVLPALEREGVTGGVYLGVGPDQNFSYIAQVKPSVAFLIDIRRDNALLHLLFKAIFAMAPTRVEYLAILTGRAPPAQLTTWRTAGIDRLIAHIDGAGPIGAPGLSARRVQLEAHLAATAVPLSAGDRQRIADFHRTFIDAGLSLVFQARGRAPLSTYPSLRDLIRERDSAGRQLGFLASEPAYQVVRSLHARDAIIPVVGDVSGARAMRAIAAEIATRGETLSAFYISNVEQYLFNDGRMGAYVENLKRLPRSARSTIIRSVFPSGYRGVLPQTRPGDYSTSLTQPMGALLADVAAGRYRSYGDLVTSTAVR